MHSGFNDSVNRRDATPTFSSRGFAPRLLLPEVNELNSDTKKNVRYVSTIMIVDLSFAVNGVKFIYGLGFYLK